MSEQNENGIAFDLPKNQSAVIKVIGVGGGGSNAVNHMFHAGIKGVDFVVCNTDAQALTHSPVPNKVQLGTMLTEGLGAGADPEMGRQAAIENLDEIKVLLERNTKMVFITAGMGGGTGTGAAPVVAKLAKEMGILTVGIVTMPFEFEGNSRRQQALEGVQSLSQCVDSLIVINNNKLRDVYGNLGFKAGFSKADEVLATAAKGIAEVITHHYTTNIDLRDAKTVLQNSGTAIMGSAKASGPDRAEKAIKQALDSPLLNNNQIKGAKNVLLLIVSGVGEEEITIDEIGEINDHIQNEAGGNANIIMGVGEDLNLENAISVTIIATGFSTEQQNAVVKNEPPVRVVIPLEDEVKPMVAVVPQKQQPVPAPEQIKKNVVVQPSLFEDNLPKETAALVDQNIETDERPRLVVFDADATKEVSPADFDETEEVRFVLLDDEEEITEIASDTSDEVAELPSFEMPEVDFEMETPPVAETPRRVFELGDLEELERSLQVRKPLDALRKQQEEEKKAQEIKAEKEEFKYELRATESHATTEAVDDLASPFDMSIEEAMRNRNLKRREALKAFNYSFKNLPNGISDMEKIPAYKRLGLELDNSMYSSTNAMGSMSVSGSGQKVELKSNNSFLHDNVD
jgi:cell division protein FtsZ